MQLAGRPLVSYALDVIRACSDIDEIVVVVASADVERARRWLLRTGGRLTERVVPGGTTRQSSVRAGLSEINPACDLVLVHDAARPFLDSELVTRCLNAARQHGAVSAGLPASDTVKQVGPNAVVTSTLERTSLWIVQTPQAFRYHLLVDAHEAADRRGTSNTDDASLVEALGHPVHMVRGDPGNTKITWPEDLARAERELRNADRGENRRPMPRSGIGFDAHRFTEDRPLVLGGVLFPGEQGLLGHSDADVVCHAICDALLGAAAAGDIGQHFPDSDPKYAGIRSISLLRRVAEIVRASGWEIENVDAVVIAQAPRIAERIPELRRALAESLGTDIERVSIKAKTTEGMGFTGRGEGIACEAIGVLRPAQDARAR
jgi:2-C-methyl-D-erythritol 4-phosphate cytidylyltransferase/2-C-methyl-D-erythritol 2,4-cyclodiphosphate synthase